MPQPSVILKLFIFLPAVRSEPALRFKITSMLLRERMELVISELVDGQVMLDEAVTEFEKLYIETALARYSDHLSNTAAALGIHRNTLAKRVSSYRAVKVKKKRASRP